MRSSLYPCALQQFHDFKVKPTTRMRRCRFFLTFVIFLLELTFVEAIQKRYTEKDVCNETKQTLVRVKSCPEDETAFNERSQAQNCDEYPKCQDKALFYHCVRENEDSFVEVCAPNQYIIGGFCPVYEENVGRVVEDYNTPCFDCHKGYDSYDYFKYSECVQTREVSTYQTSTSHKIKNDAATSGSSLHIVDTTVGTQTHGNPNGSNDKSINETQRPRRNKEIGDTGVVIGITLLICFLLLFCVMIYLYRKY